MESKRVVFLFSLLIIGLVSDATSPKRHHGAYQPISDVKDSYVVEIAKFALKEHNKSKSDKLVLKEVVSGWFEDSSVSETHSDSVNKYMLIIKATSPHAHFGKGQTYQAIVEDKPSTNYRSLFSFKKSERMN